MEFIIDTVDLKEIEEAVEYLPISGVTSNPSIVKATSPENFFDHMRKIREMIGMENSLHIQVTGLDCETMVKEAKRIVKEIDDLVYIKVPVSYEGIKAIKELKARGINVTATAVYDLMQAYMALEAGADYIAPYVNRIGNLGSDPFELIHELSSRIEVDGTAPVAVLNQIFKNPNIEKAVADFNNDWYAMYGEGKGICDL